MALCSGQSLAPFAFNLIFLKLLSIPKLVRLHSEKLTPSSTNQSINQSIASINQSISQWHQSINQSISSINQSVNQSINPSTIIQSINRINQSCAVVSFAYSRTQFSLNQQVCATRFKSRLVKLQSTSSIQPVVCLFFTNCSIFRQVS